MVCPEPSRAAPYVALAAPQTVLEVGAAQGLDIRDGFTYVLGDRGHGVIEELQSTGDEAFTPTGRRVRLEQGEQDTISHPTGLTSQAGQGTFVGNSVGTAGQIFEIDWENLLATGVLDNALLHTIDDDVSDSGSRPEFVRSQDTWLLATAEYTDVTSTLRFYDPDALRSASKTSEPGVLVREITVGPFVQSLFFHEESGDLFLIRNPDRGRGWTLDRLDLPATLATGEAVLRWSYEPDEPGELEGMQIRPSGQALFITSSGSDNLRLGRICDSLQ